MLRRPAQQVVSKHEGDLPPHPAPDLSPLAAPVNGGWRAMGREDIARLHRLYYDPGIEVKEIARVWRVSTSTLLRWIDEMDWPSRRELTRQAAAQRLAIGREIRQAAASDADFGAATDAQRQAQESEDAARRAREGEALEWQARQERRERQERQEREEVAPRPASPSAALRLPQDFDETAPVDSGALVNNVERAVRRELALIEAQINDPTPGARERNARALSTLVRTLNGLKDLRAASGLTAPRGGDDGPRPPRNLDQLRAELAADLERLHARNLAAAQEDRWSTYANPPDMD